MLNIIKDILSTEGITRVGCIKIDDCEIINQRILPEDTKSVILFSIPYRSTREIPKDGFSEYSRIYDYHNFCEELYSRTLKAMQAITGEHFYGFCDHSPINEKTAIAKCGLGVIGRNSLFIDKVFGSFVFIGSILTSADIDSHIFEIENCINCGKCTDACPSSAILNQGINRHACLSGISQKKSKTDEEKSFLKKNNTVWGCDICQLVCPYNINAEISPIAYFKNTRIPHITKEWLSEIDDDQFNKYAFSYKGRKIVLDNIEFK